MEEILRKIPAVFVAAFVLFAMIAVSLGAAPDFSRPFSSVLPIISDEYPDDLEWVFHTEIATVLQVQKGSIYYTLVFTVERKDGEDAFIVHRWDESMALPPDDFEKKFSNEFRAWINGEVVAIIVGHSAEYRIHWLMDVYKDETLNFMKEMWFTRGEQ